MAEASARAGVRSALAGKAAGDEPDPFELLGSGRSDIVKNRDSWPSRTDDFAPRRVRFDEPLMPNPGHRQAEIQQPSTAEQRAA
jgi:hypothetical protein